MIGRALGVGVRVLGRFAGQTVASWAASPQAAQPRAPASGPVIEQRFGGPTAGQMAAQAGRGLSRGVGGFLKPFRRVGGIVWLEVTGFFFLLFAVLFVFRLWQNWAILAKEPLQRDSVIAVVVVFLYLGVSSFWRARRRSQQS